LIHDGVGSYRGGEGTGFGIEEGDSIQTLGRYLIHDGVGSYCGGDGSGF